MGADLQKYEGVRPVASPGGSRNYKRKVFKGDTHKYYKIHAINSDKLQAFILFLGRQPRKRPISESVRGHVPQCHIAGDANGLVHAR